MSGRGFQMYKMMLDTGVRLLYKMMLDLLVRPYYETVGWRGGA